MKTFEVSGKEYPVKIMKKFINVLRSGKYKQGKGQLQRDDSFCCLGVGCMEFIPKKKRNLDGYKKLNGGFPYFQQNAPLWLQDINCDFAKKTGEMLSFLNDASHSHPEIADLLQAVYIEKVLDSEAVL